MCMTSLIFNWKLGEAELKIVKQSFEQREWQFSEPLRCFKMWEYLSEERCSQIDFTRYNRHHSLHMKTYKWLVIVNLQEYTFFQNGCSFSILLFTCKLALIASFKGKYSFEFRVKNEAARGNLQENKRILKWQPFWNNMYRVLGPKSNSWF